MAISVFISYALESEEHSKRVRRFANRLRMEGIDVQVFTEMKLGERIPVFMEQIEAADFTLIICTPEYSSRANKRAGGVGYEWNIVTTSVADAFDERKFIPVLFSGDWDTSVPLWARGKLGLDYRDESEEEFQKLINRFLEYEATKYAEEFDDYGNTVYPPKETLVKEKRENMMCIVGENDGETDVVEVILPFKFIDTEKEYVIFTQNEKDREGNDIVHVSEVIRDSEDEPPTLQAVSSEEDWARVKEVLWELIESDGTTQE